MYHIQVLGPGCARCNEVERLVKGVVTEYEVAATVEKVTDFAQMAALGVFSTPAVVIDGVVKTVGRVPRRDELLDWLAVG